MKGKETLIWMINNPYHEVCVNATYYMFTDVGFLNNTFQKMLGYDDFKKIEKYEATIV